MILRNIVLLLLGTVWVTASAESVPGYHSRFGQETVPLNLIEMLLVCLAGNMGESSHP